MGHRNIYRQYSRRHDTPCQIYIYNKDDFIEDVYFKILW